MDNPKERAASAPHQFKDPKAWILAIVASIIASLALDEVLRPAFGWISKIVIGFLSSTGSSLLDKSVSDATGSPELLLFSNIAIISSAFVSFVTIFSFISCIRILSRKANQNSASFVDKFRSLRSNRPRTFSIIYITIAIYMLVFGASFIIRAVLFVDSCEMAANYREVSSILAATLPDSQIKSLDAEWAALRSAKGYEAFAKKINGIARDKHIKLPPPPEI